MMPPAEDRRYANEKVAGPRAREDPPPSEDQQTLEKKQEGPPVDDPKTCCALSYAASLYIVQIFCF